MYFKNMIWEILDIKNNKDKVIVDLKINNIDMVFILKKNFFKLGEMMLNLIMKDIDFVKKKEFNIILEFVKFGDNYVCKVN